MRAGENNATHFCQKSYLIEKENMRAGENSAGQTTGTTSTTSTTSATSTSASMATCSNHSNRCTRDNMARATSKVEKVEEGWRRPEKVEGWRR